MARAATSEALVLRRAIPGDHDALLALQHRAYARNRDLLGVEPLPLKVDYRAVLAEKEVWVADGNGGLAAALVLEARRDDLLIESIAVDPECQKHGQGRALLAAAEARAQELGFQAVRLYTGSPLVHLIDWYGRHGFRIERIEALSDRSITHLVKTIS
jgi:ribosomal protein S18 acetylase RimI-like enzyme